MAAASCAHLFILCDVYQMLQESGDFNKAESDIDVQNVIQMLLVLYDYSLHHKQCNTLQYEHYLRKYFSLWLFGDSYIVVIDKMYNSTVNLII